MVLTWIVVFLLVASVLAAKQASSKVWGIAFGILLIMMSTLAHGHLFFKTLSWLVFIALYLPLGVASIRRKYVTKKFFAFFKKKTPSLSETEQQVINAGKVSWEREIFKGDIDWHKLSAIPKPTLSAEEQAFMEGPVTELCKQLNEIGRASCRERV